MNAGRYAAGGWDKIGYVRWWFSWGDQKGRFELREDGFLLPKQEEEQVSVHYATRLSVHVDTERE